MNKTAIKNFAVWARQKLIADIIYKAAMLGITEKGIADKLPQSTDDLHFFDIGTKDYSEISGVEIQQREALEKTIRDRQRSLKNYRDAFDNVVEEVAYTWFNRLIAIRFMEVNDYLPSGVRVLSSENKAKTEPDFVTSPFDTDLDFTPYEQDRVIQLKDENKLDELFRMLFIKQCNKLNEILPELFEKTDDYTELLLTISFTDKDGVVYHLTHDIDEDDFNIKKTGQVEIIGWLYQYYITELNELVYDGSMSKSHITKELLPAATTIYTPHWTIQYMVQNSLGRLWLEGHPNDTLKDSWKYYIDEAEQEPAVVEKLDEIRSMYKEITPEKIKVIDPCMGSGHILVYAFDLLMQIYESNGYTQRDATRQIIENNLYGLEIDDRATQLAYFALMMKARSYDRRFLTRGIRPNLCSIQESNNLNTNYLELFGELKPAAQKLVRDFVDAKEYGSILNLSVSLDEISRLEVKYEEIDNTLYDNLFDTVRQAGLRTNFAKLIRQAKIMVQKYDVVVTNPPYLGNSRFSTKLDDYIKDNYPNEKSDLSMVMYKKALTGYGDRNAHLAFITTTSWMFLSSFEKVRQFLSNNATILSLVDFGTELFDGKVGHNPIVSWVTRNAKIDYIMTAVRLVDYCYSRRDQKVPEFFNIKNRFTANQSNFSKIPGSPIAYWVSENFIRVFEKGISLSDIASPKQGMATADNNRFLREWYEVNDNNISFNTHNLEEAINTNTKWFPYNKGGEFRKWYGNNDYVVNWKNDGFEIRNFEKSVVRNPNYYFKKCFSWSKISSGSISFRFKNYGNIFDVAGTSVFAKENDIYYLLGLSNSNVSLSIFNVLSPTLNYEVGHIASLPVITDDNKKIQVDEIVKENIGLSKDDWDSFETSWDFIKHPLLNGEKVISKAFDRWSVECDNRFNQLKANEEELNRIFIDIYSLQDELTPEVEDRDVTVRKADLQRDIKSLISYAVGCMFGRYSLDTEGLAYAGGEWDDGKYSTFIPDTDNCIPITDEEYFEDDIVGLFCAWLKKVYGKDTLEENLDFIAKALGNKGKTSREVIRNYFLNDFIKDHIKIYQKRLIYWLFDSGKQNGFKALVYMHRWNADTIGNMRVEYLHRTQRVYEKEIDRMQEIIDNSRDNKEISTATKRKEKLQKQVKETREYDEKVAHLALSRIDIDLDDGVKVNYEKVQTAPDGKKIQILVKI